MRRMSKRRKLIRIPVFAIVVFLALLCVQRVFGIRDYSIYSREHGFKQEKKNAVDAVYIGASHVFSFFEPPLAWNDYGIAVFDYAIPSMPLSSIEYRIREACKTQPDALYIINLNGFKATKVYNQNLHRNLDYMPWSLNKLKMMRTLIGKSGFKGSRIAEYFLPLIRFHSSWSTLKSEDFDHPVNGLKGAYTYGPYLTAVTDMTGQFSFTQERGELSADQEEALKNILALCEEKNLKVLFVMAPQKLDEEFLAQINTIEDIVTEKGYDCLDLRNRMEEMQIRMDTDFHDENHLNVHGAIKYTDYLARYLQETYGFSDRRGEAGMESWDRSVSLYMDVIGAYCLDIERTHAPRDFSMVSPKAEARILEETEQSGQGAEAALISWEETPGADGYAIYCKTGAAENGWWHRAGETDGSGLSWVQEDLTAGAEYTWTVVPFRKEGEEILCGSIDMTGVSLTVPEDNGNAGEGEEDDD